MRVRTLPTKEEALDAALALLNDLRADYGGSFGNLEATDNTYEVSYTDPADGQTYTDIYYWA